MFTSQRAVRRMQWLKRQKWQRRLAIAGNKLPIMYAILRFVTLSLWFIVLFSWAIDLATSTDNYWHPVLVAVLYAFSLYVAALHYNP